MPQIFDVTANENMRYKCNELELEVRARKEAIYGIILCQDLILNANLKPST